jgi:hypothetical protein
MSEVDWQEFAGKRVRVRAPRDSFGAEIGPDVLGEAERSAAALERLLSPEQGTEGEIEILLVEGPTESEDSLVHVVEGDAPAEPITWPLTRFLVHRWFGVTGQNAIVEGIAGYVAAQTEAGPNLKEIETWARDRSMAGGDLSVVGVQAGDDEDVESFEEPPPELGADDGDEGAISSPKSPRCRRDSSPRSTRRSCGWRRRRSSRTSSTHTVAIRFGRFSPSTTRPDATRLRLPRSSSRSRRSRSRGSPPLGRAARARSGRSSAT